MRNLYALRGALLLLCLSAIFSAPAQTIYERLKVNPAIKEFNINPRLQSPSSISFKPTAGFKSSDARSIIKNTFGLSSKAELRSISSTVLRNGITVEKFKLYFGGIRVEHSAYNVISKDGMMQAIMAESYNLPDAFVLQPQLSEADAQTKALAFVRASKYVWDALEEDKRLYPGNAFMQARLNALKLELSPKAELVIAKDLFGDGQAKLAWKYDIYAVQPLSRHLIYVDAVSGKILISDAVIKHAAKDKADAKPDSLYYVPNYQYYGLATKDYFRYGPTRTTASVQGAGLTRYAGTRQIMTTKVDVVGSAQDPNNTSAVLQYSGVDPRLAVTGTTSVYILKDDTRGGGIETYDCNAVGGLPLSLPGIHAQALAFVDKDNNWKNEVSGLITQEDLLRGATANGTVGVDEAFNDDIAIDAHWGASMVYDYWRQVHNRLSFDNKNTAIRSYVHYGPAYDNAFWNGSVMTYGDGTGTAVNSGFRPLTSLDVCGHEIGHGVCSFTADLVYQSESGAMNEGLSDIWAAAIERYVNQKVDATLPYQYWQIGEQIAADNIGLRRMDNPKAKTDPDTYGGRYWANPNCTPTLANDQCGVHTNSGVLNKWFYLLVQGPKTITGSPAYTDDGIADRPRTTPAGTDWVENVGNNYGALTNFIGLGFDKAEAITYLMELSLTPNATFAEARLASLNAASALYGPCSQEVISLTQAWYAVNVGAAWGGCTAPTLSTNFLTTTVTEGSGDCGTFTEYAISVILNVPQPTPTTINLMANSVTAESHDYQLSTNSVSFNAGEIGSRSAVLRIFNDDIVEGDETLTITTNSALNGFNSSQTITIKDDDVTPRIGNTFTLLSENFEAVADDALPAGWARVDKTSPSGGRWNVRQTPGASTIAWLTKRAYVYNPNLLPALQGQAVYDPMVASQIILRTGLIDARGLDSVRLRFVWSAGGETACSPACDYGDVVYSFDGVNFNRFDTDSTSQGASAALFISPTDSVYNQILPGVVSGKQFYIGFRWTNDALLTMSPNSITIDNVLVTGQGRKVETDSMSGVSSPVKVEPGTTVYFYSRDDKGLMSSISNASADLGCVRDSLIQTGNGPVRMNNGDVRSRKVFEITPSQNATATYTLTLYFTAAEVSGFSVPPSQLRLLKTNVTNIDQATPNNSVTVTPVFTDSSAQGFYAYTGTFTGFSKFALIQPVLAPLPVNCLGFTAKKEATAVVLNWRVSDQRTGTSYQIERSADGINYEPIITIDGGTATGYTYRDGNMSGLRAAWYRVKAVEANGAPRYLCTVLYVSLKDKADFVVGAIYPNPGKATAMVNVSLGAAHKLQVEYLNATGQLIGRHSETLPAGTTPVSLRVQSMAAGSYLVRFKDEEGRIVSSQAFIKQ